MILLALCLASLSVAQSAAQAGLGIFNVITFPNKPCTASSGLNGTCLTADECTGVSGSASGSCASGFGVCCTVSKTCGGESSTNNTYLDQSSTTAAATCSYTICPANTDVCQLRVDFETFEMAAASSSTGAIGTCVDDNLVISNPSGPNPPMVCGTLTGQHMYVTASASCHTFTSVIGATDTSTSRTWSIKVSQIECTSPVLPPSGCLQYFTGTTGYFSNFGWDGSQDGATAATANHQNNQQYSVCFRREEGYCSIEYFTPITGFSVGGTASIASESLYGDVACYQDYLQIPGILASPTTFADATAYTAIIGNRVCGLGWTNFPSPVATAATLVSYVKPFIVGVNFDGSDELVALEGTSGFSILYTQKACA